VDVDQICFQLGPVSASGEGPLYSQIVSALRREIGAGRLSAGMMLPSVRALAEGLLVSVITVKRAYEELEREGLLSTRQGLGTFVSAAGSERARAQAETAIRRAFAGAAAAAKSAGLSEAKLVSWLRDAFRKTEEN
jgi:GntR family transcriptional regulator